MPAFALSAHEQHYKEMDICESYEYHETTHFLLAEVCSLLQAVMHGLAGGKSEAKPQAPQEIWQQARMAGTMGFTKMMERFEMDGTDSQANEKATASKMAGGVTFE